MPLPEGRPTVMTPETIKKLEDVFLIGGTDKEACLVADISMATLYTYCQQNPEFSDRKEMLKDMLKYQARANIASDIKDKKNSSTSQWYLERKVKDEFAFRTENTGKAGEAIKINVDPTKAMEITKEYEEKLKASL